MAHPGGGGGKRKRGDRSYTGEFNSDGGFRPSQYRAGGGNTNNNNNFNVNNNNNSGGNYPHQGQPQQQHQHQHQHQQQQQHQQSGAGTSRDLGEGGRGAGNIGVGRGGNSAGGRRGNRSRNGPSRKFSEPIHGQNPQIGQTQQGRQQQQQQSYQQHQQRQQHTQQSQQQLPSRQQTPQSQFQSQPHSQPQTPRSQQQQQHQQHQQQATPRAQPRREPSDTSSSSRPAPVQPAISVSSEAESSAMATTSSNDMPPPAVPQATSQPSAPAQPSRRAASYAYEHLTDQRLSSWADGRQQVLETSRQACEGDDTLTLSTIFQEVIQSVLAGRIPATEGGVLIKAIVGEDSSQDAENPTNSELSSVFLDTLSIITESEAGPNPILRTFIASTGISPALMRRQLDSSLLQSLGMIRDTFVRMGIRKQTNLLYRQSNYNLLREESEGYSKLLTELFTTSNNEAPSSEVVKDTFERVKAMIGAFDMDVGRVLDVTLDVFAAVLVKQYRFFVKFLRVSSWWPRKCSSAGYNNAGETGLPKWALPESGGWSTTEEDRKLALKANEERDRQFWDRVREIGLPAFFEIGRDRADIGRSVSSENMAADNEETREWIEQTGVTPPRGNRVAAQLLGFKLRFYSSKNRDPNDILPDNLIYLAALLIKIGFISLRDLYPHLWRPDDKMGELREEKMREKLAREKAMRPGAGVMNALMTSGALGDDAVPTPRGGDTETRTATPATQSAEEESKQEESREPQDQKVLLLKSLLAIGALPESLYILGKFPWLLDVYPELPEFLHRIIHHSLSKVYASVRPPASLDQSKRGKRPATAENTAALKGAVRLGDSPQRRVLRWAQLDRDDENDGTSYRYYWDDWSDNIPICQTVDDVFALCTTFLNLSGVKIGRDPALLTKLARIGKESLRADGSEENRFRWRQLCKQILVPALSLTKQNPGVVNEVFDLLSFFPRDARYNIYAEWYSGQTSRSPDIKSTFDQAKAETKDALKRLSKTNIRPMARTLAKIAFANPGIVINVAITQIEAYENLIEVVVECARYFTYLGYDILTWSLISSLGQKGRSRVQQGGMFTSRWLNSLSSFVGRVFKRYSSIMDPVPILQYVAEQLRQNNSTDLIVLEQLVSSMAGIVTDSNFNDAQVQAMAGGELLQSQTMLQLLDKRHESKITSKRLIKSLTESNLAGQLLILIAQERLTCIFKAVDEAAAELKLLGNIFDEIHRVLTQYIDLLRSNFTIEEFDSHVPDAPTLISQYGLTHEIAFWIVRPSLAHRIRECDEARELQQKEEQKEEPREKPVEQSAAGADEDVEMLDEGEMREDDQEEEAAAQEIIKEETSLAETKASDVMHVPSTSDDTPWHPVLVDLMEQVKEAIPKTSWEVIGLPFFTSFWQLSLYDLHIPQKQYEDEMEKQKKQVIAISNDRSDLSTAGMQKREKQKNGINDLNDRILAEYKRHLRAYGDVRMRLNREKDHWFADMRGKHNALNIAILEQCLLPRLLLSPTDAFYCFKMLKYLHSSGATCFRTMGLIDQLFNDQRLIAIIFQSTSREADNLGRFLNDVLRDLGRWHADKSVYTKEAYGSKKDLPGFAKSVGVDGKPSTFLDYEDFRRLLYKWHRLFCAALKTCLNSGEYMHIRNAISVLKAVVQHFPSVNWMGTEMRNLVNNLKSTDPRDDVKIPAASLIGDFNRRESKWVLPQMFHLSDAAPGDKKGQKQAQAPPAEAKPLTPTPTQPTPTELIPTVPATTDDSASVKDSKLDQAEEGEIEPTPPVETARLPSQHSNVPTQAPSNIPSAVPVSAPGTPSGSMQSRRNEIQSQTTRATRTESPGTASGGPETAPAHPMNLPLRPDLPRRPSDNDGRGRRDQMDRHEHGRPGRPGEQNRQQRGRLSDRPQEMRRFEQPLRQEPVDQTGRLSPRDGRSSRDPNRQPRGRGRGEMSQTDIQEQSTATGAAEMHQTRLANIQAEELGAPRDKSFSYPEGPQRRHDEGRSPREDRRQRVPRTESPTTEQAHLPERPDRDARRPQHQRHDEPPTAPRANFADKRGADNRQTNLNQQYGRLNQDGRFPNRQNEGIERPHDAPSGPRRGGGAMRPPANVPRNQSPHAAQMLHEKPPSGPSHRQNRSISATESSNQTVLSQQSDVPTTPGMHPDRMKQIDGAQRFPQSGIGAVPPSGPRASVRSARQPQRSNDRPRDGNRSQIQHVQQILHSSTQGSVDQSNEGTSIRGRGAQRQPNANLPDTAIEKRSELFPDDGAPTRPGDKKDETPRQFRGGRRGELIDGFSDQRKPPRASSSRTHSSERGDRASETGRDREKDRDRDHDAHRRHDDDHLRPSSTRKDDHRERHRNIDRERERPRGRDHDRDRERDRDRTRDIPPEGGSRGDQMRRGEPSSGVNREAVGTSGRGRRDNFDRNEKRAGPSNEANVHPLPPGPRPEERTRDRESHRPRDRDRSERERDHTRDREREGDRERPRERDRDRNRDRDRDMDPAHPPPNGSGNWPRKRNRPSSAMEGGGPEGPGPARFGHDNKRPRRGH